MWRFAIENRSPVDYHPRSYYERWLAALEQLLAARQLVSAEELSVGRPLGSPRPIKRILAAEDVDRVLSRGSPVAYGARPLQAGRLGARKEYPSGDAYAPAALRARPSRHDRAGARLSRVSRPQCARRGRAPAMALHGVLRGPRIVGRGSRSKAQGISRCLGTLSRSAGALRAGWLQASGNEQFLIDEARPRCVTLAGSCRG
jgi:hypothetical protein